MRGMQLLGALLALLVVVPMFLFVLGSILFDASLLVGAFGAWGLLFYLVTPAAVLFYWWWTS